MAWHGKVAVRGMAGLVGTALQTQKKDSPSLFSVGGFPPPLMATAASAAVAGAAASVSAVGIGPPLELRRGARVASADESDAAPDSLAADDEALGLAAPLWLTVLSSVLAFFAGWIAQTCSMSTRARARARARVITALLLIGRSPKKSACPMLG